MDIRCAQFRAGLGLLGLLGLAGLAQGQVLMDERPPPTLSLQGSAGLAAQTPTVVNLQQALWARRGALSLGLQARSQALRAEATTGLSGLPPQPWQQPPASLHMGLAMDLSRHTRIELTTPVESVSVAPLHSAARTDPQGLRLSLQLDPAPDPTVNALRSGLRLELDSQSRFMLKPRGGGLTLYYSSRF